MRNRTLLGTTIALATVFLWTAPARAELDYFTLTGLEAVTDGLDLDDRLGTSSGVTDHVINIEDCEAYKGGTVKAYWTYTNPPSDTDYAVTWAYPSLTCGTDVLEDLSYVDEDTCPRRIVSGDDLGSSGNFEFDLDDILDLYPDESGVDCLIGEEFTSYVYFIVAYSDETYENEAIEFTVDLDAPSAPTDVEAIAGENSVRVSWVDDVNTEGDVEYRVYYRANSPISEIDDADGSSRSGEDATALTITGLQTNVVYYFRVVAIDVNDNESGLSENSNVYATTIPATDFWEHYQDEGGEAAGGFCFIATAAYGTELESQVHWLRRFRDQVLMPSTAGRAFVDWYYENSPPAALFIQRHPVVAAVVRVALAPFVFLAWFLLGLGLAGKIAVVTGGWALWRLGREIARRRFATGAPALRPLQAATPAMAPARRLPGARLGVAVLAGALFLGTWASPAQARLYIEDEFDGDSPQHILLELKFGPYKPNIDSEFDGASPYEDVFGGSSFLLSAIQLEYEFFQDWGVASTGVGLGFARNKGSAIMAGGESGIEKTSLFLMPLNVSLTYHLDVMAKEWKVPLVPYVRAGFDYVIWWTTDGLGDLSDWKADAADSAKLGYGGTWGWHVSGGIKLLLDILAPTMARTFDQEIGVNNSYLFAEYLYLRADNFGTGKGLRVGDGTFLFGLAFEI